MVFAKKSARFIFFLWPLTLLVLLFAYFIYRAIAGCNDGLFIGLCFADNFVVPIKVGWSYVLYMILLGIWKRIKSRFGRKVGLPDVGIIGILSLLPFFGYTISVLDIPIFQSIYGYAAGLMLITFVGLMSLFP